jgi:hypothetical protein
MIKNLKRCCLILPGMMLLFQTNLARIDSVRDSTPTKIHPLFSGLHTLSIHVRDTVTHDSIFHFFADKLKLPVYYYPVRYGNRKYAGIYSGNLVLEPCGPYSNYKYATNDFRAIFFGLTFEPYESISESAIGLASRDIHNQVQGAGEIYLQNDSELCGDNITISLIDRLDARIYDQRRMDSLRFVIKADTGNELGIEYVKEISIGYKDHPNLQKWKELISPMQLIDNEIWHESGNLDFHFIKSNINEVQSITFKVISLEKAKRYLLKNNLYGSFFDNKIQLQKTQTFGLSIYLSEAN